MISLLILLIVAGFILFLFNRFAPIDGNVKALINYLVMFVLILFVILFVLDITGLYHSSFRLK
jgi:hypothetical protein